MKKFLPALIPIIILALGLVEIIIYKPPTEEPEYSYQVYRSRTELNCEGAKNNVIAEMERYIDSVAPGSCLNSLILFEKCEQYGVDVMFVMAQGQLESNFGTRGIASKTNSVWNVMTYDGWTAHNVKRKGHGYDHPDHSIEPYLKLLTSSYLCDTVCEQDLMIRFVNHNGLRYASDKSYEKNLFNIYNRILNRTNLQVRISEYEKYKILAGR